MNALRFLARPALAIRSAPAAVRPFSGTAAPRNDTPKAPDAAPAAPPKPAATASSAMSSPLADLYRKSKDNATAPPPASSMRNLSNALFGGANAAGSSSNVVDPNAAPLTDAEAAIDDSVEPYHFHIYSHKHNTHITVTRPDRNPIIAMSCGNIGIRKSRRKNYDAAYQLTAYVLERLYHQGWQHKIKNLEVILKGFGQGREAATKVLLGQEGKLIADKIKRVSDATTIKFGGTRSKNPRRI
ncbi:hypothetical protein TD95_001764 [Thielaviopsis punctulata]|uniref:Ribosomal protein S11 n=1 Tax=Thielaviopsis punctulata TaxID=72032 RepID=A0A0F4Z716_9PEZI|nr:hypothetical protein TD95_001764 [Thielaviopsis punctulata]